MLEHVADPKSVIGEMYRILKSGGRIICYLPFIVPFHAAPNDFQRWTIPGIRKLFSDVGNMEIEIGIGAGPTSGMLWVLQEWLAIFFCFGIRGLHDLIFKVLMVFTAPVKLLDLLLTRFPYPDKIASGFYVVGKQIIHK
jgi:SAM-dependent methyltransferase